MADGRVLPRLTVCATLSRSDSRWPASRESDMLDDRSAIVTPCLCANSTGQAQTRGRRVQETPAAFSFAGWLAPSGQRDAGPHC
jgi:hypothetical protein